MFIEIYNVRSKHPIIVRFVRIICGMLFSAHIINGYRRYGIVDIAFDSGKVSYNILLEEVIRRDN